MTNNEELFNREELEWLEAEYEYSKLLNGEIIEDILIKNYLKGVYDDEPQTPKE